MQLHLRFIAAASLIAFGGIIVVGALVLGTLGIERIWAARAEFPQPQASVCPGGLQSDRDCLSNMTPSIDMNAGPESFEVRPVALALPASAENAPEQPLLTQIEQAAKASEEAVPNGGSAAPERSRESPRLRQRQNVKPASQAHSVRSVPKKAVRRETTNRAKHDEARKVVGRFGDTLRDVPVSSYAADGRQRTITIRPTSMQDVYYYSAR